MWPKVLIVVTCLYVAKASVPNIFDDDDASNIAEVTRTARSCGFASCNSLCRKQGHARGVCIGTYCQCRFRRRRSLDEEAAVENAVESNEKSVVPNDEQTLVDFDISVSDLAAETSQAVYEEDSSEDVSNPAEVKQTTRSCEYNECNRFCRQLGYARGVCIGTYCQCRYRVAPVTPSEDPRRAAVEDKEEASKDQTSVSSDEEPLDASDHARVARAARFCGTAECSAHCRRLGHARGVCIGSYCQCRSRLARSADLPEENTFEDNLITPKKDFVAGDEVSPVVPEARSEDCNLRWCEQNCRRIGFPGGACVNGRCKCDILRSAPAVAGNEVSPVVPEARSEDCNLRWCEQNCRRIGFPGGACVNGRCKCDILRSAPAVPAPFTKLEEEDETQNRAVRACTALTCSRLCSRLGFRFSRCSNGRCLCW